MSLRTKILIVVAVIHVAAFAALTWFFTNAAQAAFREGLDRSREHQLEAMIRLVENTIARSNPQVRDLAEWPGRLLVRTGLIIQIEDPVSPTGRPQRQRYNINAPRRPEGFDPDLAERSIARAMRGEGSMLRVDEHSYAFQIRSPGAAKPWGGAYMVFEEGASETDLATISILALLLSTLAVVVLIYLVVSFFVLRPVSALAEGAERVGRGDYTSSVPLRGGDELADLTRAFNDMMSRVSNFQQELSTEVERATQKARNAERQLQQAHRLASTGRLAAGIAHEINNPLGGLMNATQKLREGALAQERSAEYLALVADGLERIKGIVGRVLQFTPQQVAPGVFPVARALNHAQALLEHRLRQQGVQLVRGDPFDEGAEILGLMHEIQQVFLNLLINSLDALQERAGDARIAVAIWCKGRVHVCIRDNGTGVEEGDLDKIGDLFFTSKDVGKGTGLGLSLCTGIVENHAGTLRYGPAPDVGFEVHLEFPLASSGGVPDTGS